MDISISWDIWIGVICVYVGIVSQIMVIMKYICQNRVASKYTSYQKIFFKEKGTWKYFQVTPMCVQVTLYLLEYVFNLWEIQFEMPHLHTDAGGRTGIR